MKTVESKTISLDFDEQLDTAEAMEGLRLKFSFNKKDVLQLLDEATIYTEQERRRVADIIFSQMNKYRYLFGTEICSFS
ncbi:MAG: hypothetical protein LUF34_09775 [Lachnospiraceae bacterium]|nr:hypothetical protein [Lachnospiraceae bacterium]